MKLPKNETKEFLLREKRSLEDQMANMDPGDEYDRALLRWKAINDELREMSFGHKMKDALPWLSLVVTAVGSIFVPVALGKLAYRNSEEEGKLKNGDVWREAISNTTKPSQPDRYPEERKENSFEEIKKKQEDKDRSKKLFRK